MSRRDPGAASGGIPREPGQCRCPHLEPLHKPGANGRGACSASTCDCRRYQPSDDPDPYAGLDGGPIRCINLAEVPQGEPAAGRRTVS